MKHLKDKNDYSLKEGDIVKLRSGSPFMTVSHIDGIYIHCHLYIENEFKEFKFKKNELVFFDFDEDKNEWLNKNILSK